MQDRRFLSQIITPATSSALIDILTLKTLLNITSTAQDAALNLWINSVSITAQNFMNNPIVLETRYDQFWPFHDGWDGALGKRTQIFQLQRYPVTSTPSPSLTAAPVLPVLSAVTGGSLVSRTYYVRLSYTTPSGETAAGIEGNLTIPAGSLLTIASPAQDVYSLATSWSVYIGTASAGETRQASGLAIGTSWTEPSTGLVAGAAMPAYPLVVEAWFGANTATSTNPPTPLAENVDFVIDRTVGQITRLSPYGNTRYWRGLYMSCLYQAGYATVPPDIVDAVAEMVKQKYYAQTRDPMARQVNIPGVMEQSYWFGAGVGSVIDMSPHIQAVFERYKVPVYG